MPLPACLVAGLCRRRQSTRSRRLLRVSPAPRPIAPAGAAAVVKAMCIPDFGSLVSALAALPPHDAAASPPIHLAKHTLWGIGF
jgi:hypothetical protein